MPNRLIQLREKLAEQETDLQRLYKFKFSSIKLALFNIDTYIISCSHPFFNFVNSGDYRGLIDVVTKPSEINISFLENDRQQVNLFLDFWDNLKYNIDTGIHYPKAVYADLARLTYIGFKKGNTFEEATGDERTRSYILTGLYPINRESISLSYDNNAVEVVNVSFNVDEVRKDFVNDLISNQSN